MKKQTPATKRTRKRLLSALNESLSRIGTSPYARSMSDAKTYVCSVCNMPVKACKIHAGTVCREMIREGTDSWFLEDALLHPEEERRQGRCALCGEPIAAAILKKNPVAELCGRCAKKGHHLRPLPGVPKA